jgi:hypothetical protein
MSLARRRYNEPDNDRYDEVRPIVDGGERLRVSEIASNMVDSENPDTVYADTDGPVSNRLEPMVTNHFKYVFKKLSTTAFTCGLFQCLLTGINEDPNFGLSPGGYARMRIHRITSDWDPATLTWNNMPSLGTGVWVITGGVLSIGSRSGTANNLSFYHGATLAAAAIYGVAFVIPSVNEEASIDSVTEVGGYPA